MMHPVIWVKQGVTRHPQYRLAEPVDFSLEEGEQLAIVGPNASGKSLLVGILTGRYPLLMNEVSYDFGEEETRMVSECVRYITFRDSYGEADGGYYYQQRWNSQDLDDIPVVRDLLPPAADEELRRLLLEIFDMESLLDKPVILLSSGELRKFQMAKALLSAPRVVILDNPFIGLDAPTRQSFRQLLEDLIRKTRLQVMLVLSRADEIPDFITHVVPVEEKVCLPKRTLADYRSSIRPVSLPVLSDDRKRRILDLPYADNLYEAAQVVQLDGVSIRYGNRVILDALDWTVNGGERWALSGTNGSGKSTLLSLVCADNPQSYACRIALFGRKRGSGESIWDIKKHIGYVSPEMHRAYLKQLPAVDIVASGLYDSVGLYRKVQEKDRAVCEWWMDIFGIAELKDRNFLQLSSGEQRLVLLARAFVKDPELLVLDEPLHGLDARNRQLVREVIDTFCQRRGKTLIMVTHYEEELPKCIDHSLRLVRHTTY